MKNEFMQFKQLDDLTTELHIYGQIRKVGLFERAIAKEYDEEIDATSAISFKEALSEVKTDDLVVRINSEGGCVGEALSIYNQLQDFKGTVITKVDGYAASAASIIFMAGKKRIAPKSSLLMIHNAWSYGEGNANEFRKMADDLDKITQPSVDIYVEKTGQSEETIKSLMDKETWLTGTEATELGFATEVSKEDAEMSFQQNAMLSLVKENKKLKQQMQDNEILKEVGLVKENQKLKSKLNVQEDGSLTAEKVVAGGVSILEKLEQLQEDISKLKESKQQNKETKSSWDGFFNTKEKEI